MTRHGRRSPRWIKGHTFGEAAECCTNGHHVLHHVGRCTVKDAQKAFALGIGEGLACLLLVFIDIQKVAIGDVVSGWRPTSSCRGGLVGIEVWTALFGRHIAKPNIKSVRTRKDGRGYRVSRHQNTGVRVLHHAGPDRNIAIAVVAPFPAKWLGLNETGLDQKGCFIETLTRLPGVGPIGDVLVGGSTKQAETEPLAAQHVVKH